MMLEGKPIGSFLIRESQVTGLMICYVSKESYLRYDIDEIGIKEVSGQYSLKSRSAPSCNMKSEQRTFNDLFDLIGACQSFLECAKDDRHRSVIAVADLGNDRVSLFSYIPPYKTLFPPRAKGVGLLGHVPGVAKMKQPSSVSFNQWGDLAVCDTGNERVLIFGPSRALVHCISMTQPSYPQGLLTATWFSEPKAVRFDDTDRLFIVTEGGIVGIAGVPTRIQAGSIGRVTKETMDLAITYLDYRAAEALRASCWFFHDVTKRLRDRWELFPLLPQHLKYIKQLFVDWSRTRDGLKITNAPARDKDGNRVCRSFMQGSCNRPFCPLAHRDPWIDENAVRRSGAAIELSHGVCCAVSEIFGLRWWWENEYAIRAIFNTMSQPLELEERWDPMTRDVETIRTEEVEVVQVIDFDSFVELLTILMEARLKLIDLKEISAVKNCSRVLFRGVGLSALESHLQLFDYQVSRTTSALSNFF